MISIPVDMSRLTGLVCVSAPEARLNPETGIVRTDREGNTLYVVGVALRRTGTRKASVIDVQTAVEPTGITEGSPVKLVDLDATMWEIDGRHGLSYKAVQVLSAIPSPGRSPKNEA